MLLIAYYKLTVKLGIAPPVQAICRDVAHCTYFAFNFFLFFCEGGGDMKEASFDHN